MFIILPEIKHQEYANIETHATLTSGCSHVNDQRMCYLAKPSLKEERKKTKQTKQKNGSGAQLHFSKCLTESVYMSQPSQPYKHAGRG